MKNLFPLLFAMLVATETFAQAGNSGNSESDSQPHAIVSQMPEYPGGMDALRNYMITEVQYPPEARDKNIQGTVIVRFVIDTTGLVTDVSVVTPVHPLLDDEAIRVCKSMPRWTPGENEGKRVKVYYHIPITFVTEEENVKAKRNNKNKSKKKR